MVLGFTGILPFLGMIPAWIAERKGRSGFTWWLYGTTLFVVALPHALMLEDVDDVYEPADAFRPCPVCAEPIRTDATHCRFCKHDVPRGERLDESASTAFLIDNLRSPDDRAREKAIILLGDRGASEEAAIPLLRTMLEDPNRQIRIRAAWALERIQGAERRRSRTPKEPSHEVARERD
jgi:HEAT repeat protein